MNPNQLRLSSCQSLSSSKMAGLTVQWLTVSFGVKSKPFLWPISPSELAPGYFSDLTFLSHYTPIHCHLCCLCLPSSLTSATLILLFAMLFLLIFACSFPSNLCSNISLIVSSSLATLCNIAPQIITVALYPIYPVSFSS